jgi:hypothetical protein
MLRVKAFRLAELEMKEPRHTPAEKNGFSGQAGLWDVAGSERLREES